MHIFDDVIGCMLINVCKLGFIRLLTGTHVHASPTVMGGLVLDEAYFKFYLLSRFKVETIHLKLYI